MMIAARVWGMFIIFGCIHIQARRTSDEVVNQLLRQPQRGRKPKPPKIKEGDETGYVTNAEFANAVNILQAEVSQVSTMLGTLDDDVTEIKGRMNTDHCASAPCVNLGVCFNRLDGYQCECRPGFGGVNCQHADAPMVSTILRADNGNKEGAWNLWQMCPAGAFARTFKIQLEEDQGSSGDDSAMNNIRLYCRDDIIDKDVLVLESGNGPLGTWREWQNCPIGEYLTGFKLKVEGNQGSSDDDSAVNGITMTCTKGSTVTGPTGSEGSFGSLVSCPPNHAICGVSTRIEPDQGKSDDSGLNDLQMKCCAWR